MLIDMSIGGCFAKYWDSHNLEKIYGKRVKYEHNYHDYMNQCESNSQLPWSYPNKAREIFNKWLIDEYVNGGKLSRFLAKKGIKYVAVCKEQQR